MGAAAQYKRFIFLAHREGRNGNHHFHTAQNTFLTKGDKTHGDTDQT